MHAGWQCQNASGNRLNQCLASHAKSLPNSLAPNPPSWTGTGGAYSTNWPAAYGYGQIKTHPFKEDVIQARPAFVSVQNNVRPLCVVQPEWLGGSALRRAAVAAGRSGGTATGLQGFISLLTCFVHDMLFPTAVLDAGSIQPLSSAPAAAQHSCAQQMRSTEFGRARQPPPPPGQQRTPHRTTAHTPAPTDPSRLPDCLPFL